MTACGREDAIFTGVGAPIAITTGPNNTGGNFLTVAFQNALFSGLAGGGGASLIDSKTPNSVTFTSNFAAIVPLIAGNPPENFAISLDRSRAWSKQLGLQNLGAGFGYDWLEQGAPW